MKTDLEYRKFLERKQKFTKEVGFTVPESALNPMLFDFQKAIVQWSLRLGRSAIFADCGLGKSPIQIEWAKHVNEKTGGRVLIVAPLVVSAQTHREGIKFGVPVHICRENADVKDGVNVTNYERLDKFDVSQFSGVVLDESSCLKAQTGKVRTQLIKSFQKTPYKLCCTATPAPNDYTELGNHSEFLNVMPVTEMQMRWFRHDSMETSKWHIMGHAIKPFWEWVSSWAISLRKPSDIGEFSDKAFALPELTEAKHVLSADYSKVGKEIGDLFYSPELSATNIHKVMRATAEMRAAKVAELVKESTGPFLIWCHTNYESDALQAAIPEAVDLRGDETIDTKESKLLAFIDKKTRVLISKPSISGWGVNLQHCNQMAFVGLSYSYESYYQAVRRCWRFGQKRPVTAHLVMTDAEQGIIDAVMTKQKAHAEMQEKMYANIINDTQKKVTLTMDYKRQVKTGKGWEMVLGDCVDESKNIEDGSVDFSVFSPPFSSLYVYSDSVRDMGNSANDAEFFDHFKLLVRELYRITRPGRLIAVHCSNIPLFKYKNGVIGIKDFRGDIIKAFEENNLVYHSEVCIWKDPVIEMQRTKSVGLLHKQLCKDGSMSRQGLPDYLVVFRKWPKVNEPLKPVTSGDKSCRFVEYVGEDGPTARDARGYSIETWQRYASPVWMDIRQTNVLNAKIARTEKDEKHICPLQLDVIDRAIHLWTNEEDLVFSPFAGIGSEGYCAVRMGRRFIGIELKDAYFNQACRNLKSAEGATKQMQMFDGVE